MLGRLHESYNSLQRHIHWLGVLVSDCCRVRSRADLTAMPLPSRTHSSGYVHDPNCIYVNGTGRNHYEFFIRLNQCGTLGRQEMYHPKRPGEVRVRSPLPCTFLTDSLDHLIISPFDCREQDNRFHSLQLNAI